MSISRQFIRFAAVGLCGTAVQYGVLQIGTEMFGTPAALASDIGYLCGAVVNYLLNYFFTFESGKSHVEAATKYFSLLGIGLCINTGLMVMLVNELGWNKWYAQILSTGIGLIYNFVGSRYWAFREAHHHSH